MLAESAHLLPCALHKGASLAPIASALRLGSRHARRRLAPTAFHSRVIPYRSFSTQHQQASKSTTSRYRDVDPSTRTWGDKMVLLGLSMRGAAMLPQLAYASRVLRFAGTGPMLLGSVVTIYELGGWRLLLGIPATAASFVAVGKFADGVHAERFRTETLNEVSVACPDIPAHVVSLLPNAEVCEIETNRVRMEVQHPCDLGSAVQWRIVAYGTREKMWQPWQIVTLQVSCGVPDARYNARSLPPQTCDWDFSTAPLRWEVIWQK